VVEKPHVGLLMWWEANVLWIAIFCLYWSVPEHDSIDPMMSGNCIGYFIALALKIGYRMLSRRQVKSF
jgi:hypothetical protein